MLVVVRCPGCRGASQVSTEAVGLLVECPRCHGQFTAVEEATPAVTPASRSQPRSRPTRAEPASRAEVPRAEPRGWAEPVAPPPDHVDPRPARRRGRATAEPADHDSAASANRLPVSVLVGFALLPFAIPLLWLVAPVIMGQQPVLSLAAPSALAIAASALCLAVVYTVDWSPATRVKGVLMLVGLAYFAGLSLFYLKKDMLDRVKHFFGQEPEWKEFRPPDGSYRAEMPRNTNANPVPDQPVPGWKLTCYRGSQVSFSGAYTFVVGSGQDPQPNVPEDADVWFDEVGKALHNGDRVQSVKREHQGFPGREWRKEIRRQNGVPIVRIVQVYRIKGLVYYLCAEGPNIVADEEPTRQFFDSFQAKLPKG
jgi:hypothetical protein